MSFVRHRGERRRGAIRADPESIRWVNLPGSQTLSCHAGSRACNGLQWSGTKQRNQNQIDAIQPAEDAAPPTADDGVALPKYFPEDAVTETWVPCGREVRAESSIERIVRIFVAGVAN